MELLLQLCEKFGPYVAIMMFFIWRDFRREEHLQSQLSELNVFVRTELVELVEKVTEALNRVR